MAKSRRALRFGVCLTVLGMADGGLTASAMAWDEPEWVRQLGTDEVDLTSGVATDVRGDVYLTGYTDGSLGGDNRGRTDAWLGKYDRAGREIWKRQFGTALSDTAYGPATDSRGNVYVTGYTEGSLGGANRGLYDAWVAKFDAAGHLLWKRQLGTEGHDGAHGVAADVRGNVYVGGFTTGSLGAVNRGPADAWVAKYDAAGRILWLRQFGTSDTDSARGVATDRDGNVYVMGDTSGSLGAANRGGADIWAAKYDAAGRTLWVQQFGTASDDFAGGLATDRRGSVYLTGWTSGSLGGANRGKVDAWFAKYDTRGHALWKRQPGTADSELGYAVATDGAGNVYLTGVTTGAFGGAHRGRSDAWAAKYDPAGRVLWTRQLGTPGEDDSRGVATDVNGNVYVGGFTSGALVGVNRGEADAWFAKYSARR